MHSGLKASYTPAIWSRNSVKIHLTSPSVLHRLISSPGPVAIHRHWEVMFYNSMADTSYNLHAYNTSISLFLQLYWFCSSVACLLAIFFSSWDMGSIFTCQAQNLLLSSQFTHTRVAKLCLLSLARAHVDCPRVFLFPLPEKALVFPLVQLRCGSNERFCVNATKVCQTDQERVYKAATPAKIISWRNIKRAN